jgi:hypothetical protein
MAQHALSLEFPDTLNNCLLRIVDMSTYNQNVPVECPKLQITAPGFTTAAEITDMGTEFAVNLTACDLDLQLTNCESYRNDLPDGVYVIRYSVAPNDVVYVEYNHLRISQALNKINNLLCCLDVPNCEPVGPMKEKLREINLLSTMLKAAKAKVEYCHNPEEGMAIYTYVLAKLDKLSCSCGCGTC